MTSSRAEAAGGRAWPEAGEASASQTHAPISAHVDASFIASLLGLKPVCTLGVGLPTSNLKREDAQPVFLSPAARPLIEMWMPVWTRPSPGSFLRLAR